MRHAELDVENDCFVRHNDDSSLAPNEKKSFAGVRRMRGFGVVFTPPVPHMGIAIARERNTLTLGLKEESLFIQTPCLPPLGCRNVPSPSSFGVDSFSSFIVPSEWLTWSLSNQSNFDFDGFVVILTLVHRASWT